jgi:hypothetical protein
MTLQSLLIAALLFAGSIPAHAENLIWKCTSSADPDYANVSVYQKNQKTYLAIDEYFGDGDGYAHDLIEVMQVAADIADWATYVQVPGQYPKPPKGVEATNQSQGVVLRIPLANQGATSLVGLKGPSGNELNENFLECKKK